MNISDLTATLLKRFLTATLPGDFACDGPTITHTFTMANEEGEKLDNYEFRFTRDDHGIRMQGRSLGTSDMEWMKALVGSLPEATANLFSDENEGLKFKRLNFDEDRISSPAETVQLTPEQDGFDQCVEFEDLFFATIAAILISS